MDIENNSKNYQGQMLKSFKLLEKIGSGAFGEIYRGINTKNNFEVAIKIEPVKTTSPQLFYEAKLYQYLLSDPNVIDKGIPQVYYCSSEGANNFLVMDLLGKSLEDLFTMCKRKLSLKSVLVLGIQMISRIEYVHSRGFLHRDIKPDNFLMGVGRNSHKVYIVDFGLSKRYIDKQGKIIPYREGKNLTGTARYASIFTHLGYEQARRDDLEGLGYVLMYFLKGILPWQNLRAINKKDKYEKIKQKKIETTVESLCQGFPKEFAAYLNYCKNLKYEEKPDYEFLKKLFKDLMAEKQYQSDQQFDWTPILEEQKKKQQQQSNKDTKV